MADGACAWTVETSTSRASSLALRLSWKAREVCCSVRTSRSCSSVPVGQVRLGDGLAAAPAADEVHQAVDPAELGQHPGGPVPGGLLVEQVHHGGVHVATARGGGVALRDDRLEPLGAGVGGHDRGAGGGEPGHQRRPRGAGRPGHDDHPAGDRAGHAGPPCSRRDRRRSVER